MSNQTHFIFRRGTWSIAKELGVNQSTVLRACRNWVTHGRVDRIADRRRARSTRRTHQLPDEVKEGIISKEALEEMAYMSLTQRCELIYERYGLKLYHKTLANYYREHGIDMKFGRPQQRHLVHKEGRKEDIAGSAKELLRLLA